MHMQQRYYRNRFWPAFATTLQVLFGLTRLGALASLMLAGFAAFALILG